MQRDGLRTSTDARHRVVLSTANPDPEGAGYGGGKGGYGRMAGVMLSEFQAPDIDLVPCFHSARGSSRFYRFAFPYRLLADTVKLFRAARKADAVHMTLQYRSATPREFLGIAVCRWLRLPVLVDIRAGQFATWFGAAGRLYRAMIGWVVRSGAVVTVEGIPDVDFMRDTFGVEAVYFPNFVATSEVPEETPRRCAGPTLRLLFVGYCYDGKGVKELVAGAREAAMAGPSLQLTLVGKEHEEFAAWMDDFDPGRLVVERLGARPHEEVLELMLEHDAFCMPTRHPGEGHSNAVNEAMMMAQVIVCTRHGFLGTVLADDCCYFVDKKSARSIAEALTAIVADPDEARRRAAGARQRLLTRFTSGAMIPRLESIYRRLLETSDAEAAA